MQQIQRLVSHMGGDLSDFLCGIRYCRYEDQKIEKLERHSMGTDGWYENGVVIKKETDGSFLVNIWTLENGAMKPCSFWRVTPQSAVTGEINCFGLGVRKSGRDDMKAYLNDILRRHHWKFDKVIGQGAAVPATVELFDNIYAD